MLYLQGHSNILPASLYHWYQETSIDLTQISGTQAEAQELQISNANTGINTSVPID